MHTSQVRRQLRAAILLAAIGVSIGAEAAITWHWRYAGHGTVACGVLQTADTPDASGHYTVLRISGQRGADPIAGLFPTGQAIPGNEPYAVDNLIKLDKDGQLTQHGLGFALSSGGHANPYFSPESGYSEVFTTPSSFREVPVQFKATQQPPGHPGGEPPGRCN